MIYNIKAYRLAHHLTQAQMGELLGLSKSAISMIETGKRPLPGQANHTLIQLQKKTGDAGSDHLQVANESFFPDLTNMHRKTSADYIAVYCGDLKSEMHRLNKQISAWTEKFNDAGRQLVKIEYMLSAMRKAGSLSAYTYDSFMIEKMGAENQLKEVLKQKPELAMIRIEGIKKELEAAKKLLAKRNRFPVVDEVTDYYGFGKMKPTLPAPEEGEGLLPDGGK